MPSWFLSFSVVVWVIVFLLTFSRLSASDFLGVPLGGNESSGSANHVAVLMFRGISVLLELVSPATRDLRQLHQLRLLDCVLDVFADLFTPGSGLVFLAFAFGVLVVGNLADLLLSFTGGILEQYFFALSTIPKGVSLLCGQPRAADDRATNPRWGRSRLVSGSDRVREIVLALVSLQIRALRI